jgi:Na+/H+ antiporter NhaD/arsenite permease-like protein
MTLEPRGIAFLKDVCFFTFILRFFYVCFFTFVLRLFYVCLRFFVRVRFIRVTYQMSSRVQSAPSSKSRACSAVEERSYE